ncbi:MAG: replication factor C large subunit [Candidatus Aenigmarchaeota archaeon]|nr:replication factor C large subunit [Candidatus Aenigmarchaeota archaeon]
MELWTNKYRPEKLSGILSQGIAVSESLRWVETWKPGKALLLCGPPGTGKTLIAEVLAKEKKWMLSQMNASDKRNSEAIEESLTETSKNTTLFHSGKIILIDEIDGLSSGDRGGANAIIKIIKGSKFPIILTANDAYIPKLKALRKSSKIVKLTKVETKSIEKHLHEICKKEGIKVEESVIKNLSRWSSGDIRSAITDLQMLSEGKTKLTEKDFESLGFRERGVDLFTILPTIFRSKNINATKKVIQDCNKDPDEIFWWVENNLHYEFRNPDTLAKAYDILSKADLFRQRVRSDQNWRFKLFMIDMLSGISLAGDACSDITVYKPPMRFMMLARMKFKNIKMKSIYEKLIPYTHSSLKTVKNGYLPYLKIIAANQKNATDGLELTAEEKANIISC